MATQTPKISIYEFDAMAGEVPSWGNDIQTKARPGVDGYTFVFLGKRSRQFQLRTRSTADGRSDAEDRAEQYEAMRGEFVTVREPGGRETMSIMVMDVATQLKPLAVCTDGNSWLIETAWTMQRGG